MNNSIIDDVLSYKLSDFYKVFGDSTRIKILSILLNKEMCVSEISSKLDMSQSSISHQLQVLRQNDLVRIRKEGKSIYYSLSDDHIGVILRYGLEHISEVK